MPKGRKEKFETVNQKGLAASEAQPGFPSSTTVIRKGSKYGKDFTEDKIRASKQYLADDNRLDEFERPAARAVGADLAAGMVRTRAKDERSKYAK